MNKDQLKRTNRFYRVCPEELESLDEFAEYLDAILNGPCSVVEYNGELTLIEIKSIGGKCWWIEIEVYPKEHAPPHFHITTPSFAVSCRIDDCSILSGSILPMNIEKFAIGIKHQRRN